MTRRRQITILTESEALPMNWFFTQSPNLGHMNLNTIRQDKPCGSSLLIDGPKQLKIITNLLTTGQTILKNGSSVDRILLEYSWTDTLKQILDLGNTSLLQSFQLNLTLEDACKTERESMN